VRLLIACFVGAQALDAITFVRMVELLGIGAEANPLVARIAGESVTVAVVAKACMVAAVVGIASIQTRRVVGEFVLLVGIMAGSLGAGSNIPHLLG
jgi:hypothetical protein